MITRRDTHTEPDAGERWGTCYGCGGTRMLTLGRCHTCTRLNPTPESYAAAERSHGLRVVLDHLVDGQSGRAYAALMRTYLRQVRILGLAYAGIPGRAYDEMGPVA